MSSENPNPDHAALGGTSSRRHAFALMLGAWNWVPGAMGADDGAPLRFAISETVVGEANLNDVRPAMQIWIKRMTQELSIAIDPRVISTTQDIQDRAHRGQFDAVALNVLEYRLIAELLDSRQIVTSGGAAMLDQYLILAKQNSGIRQLGDLKGSRLCTLRNPKMCLAPAWLFTILEEGHHGPVEQFFASAVTDAKFSRVVLPVFFGQADACLTTKRGFDTMCELNPQVAKDLKVVASSPAMVVNFYIFRKNYQSVNREKLIRALLGLRASPAGGQLAALFQFDELAVQDARCLVPALGILDAADRARGRRSAGGRKG